VLASPFTQLGLIAPLVRAVLAEGYEQPTPIQLQSIPALLEGRDLLGCAQTGTGKTAAFVLPILQRLSQSNPRQGGTQIRALILTPTRELAAQIGERAGAYGQNLGLGHTVIYGGVGQRPQEQALRRGPAIVVATPGRLLDLIAQGFVKLDTLEVFVLDEADRMLDMGFIHDVRRVIRELPKQRQTLLFSATMPADIAALSKTILIDPVRVAVTPVASTTELVTQSVYFVDKIAKRTLLERVLRAEGVERTLVFTRTKHGANRVAEQIGRGGIGAAAIHGNKSQTARERALRDFKEGRIAVLVATDIAARGIDIDGISHVINFDLPNVPESYVHRIGRTGRAGASGTAVSFCDGEERAFLRDIERLIRLKVPVADAAELPPAPERVQADLDRRQNEARGDDRERSHTGGGRNGGGRSYGGRNGAGRGGQGGGRGRGPSDASRGASTSGSNGVNGGRAFARPAPAPRAAAEIPWHGEVAPSTASNESAKPRRTRSFRPRSR
jgi:ATP-dependent RNA helicase RhlE